MQIHYQIGWHTPVSPALKMMKLEVHRFKASEAKPGPPSSPLKEGSLASLLWQQQTEGYSFYRTGQVSKFSKSFQNRSCFTLNSNLSDSKRPGISVWAGCWLQEYPIIYSLT